MLSKAINFTGATALWAVITVTLSLSPAYGKTYLEEEEEIFNLPLAEQYYTRGLQLLDNHNFSGALFEFQRAHEWGLRNTKVHYNLGACYYNLGRYAEAESAFVKASTDRNISGLVFYNLALIAYEQHQLDQSQHWLEYAILKSDNYNLHNQIKALYTQTELRRWHGAIIMGLGSDDNVTLSADSQSLSTTNNSDNLTELLAYGSGHVGASKLRLTLSAYQLRYQTLSQYDVGMLSLNGQREFKRGQWQFTPGLDVSQVLVDQQNFNRTIMLSIKAEKLDPRNHKVEWQYDINYTGDLDGNYDYLNGTRQRLKVRSSWQGERLKTKLGYIFEYNQRKNYQNITFTNYSPQRHTLSGEFHFKLLSRLSAVFNVDYRHSDYKKPNTFVSGNPVSREDQRLTYSLGLSHNVAEHWELGLSYEYSDNQSNIAIYQHQRSLASLEINYLW